MPLSPLVIYYKQLGDVLLLEPALAKLAAASGAPVMLATRPAFAPLLSLMENVLPMPRQCFRRASEVVSFDPRPRACLLAASTWAKHKRLILTYSNYFKPWHSLFFPDEQRISCEAGIYRARYFFNEIAFGEAFSFRPPRLRPPPLDWQPQGLPSRYVLIHPTSAWRRKCWRPDYWAQSIKKLIQAGFGPFVITGGKVPWEVEYVNAIAAAGGEFINYCGKTTLPQYLSVVFNAEAVLCVDGSSSHIASAFDLPSLTLFGPSCAAQWHYSTPKSKLLDARFFTEQTEPRVADIPPLALIDAFVDLMMK